MADAGAVRAAGTGARAGDGVGDFRSGEAGRALLAETNRLRLG